MNRTNLERTPIWNGQFAAGNEQELYKMTDEVCCSPEFPQGCISAE
ncbi:hypothetical protein [Marasmitruncus massiliensis]|jgi:hypothetical protein|nr:hypothetical protein [Marasmitruncus massiliensis]